MNAVLQCLANSDSLIEAILHEKHPDACLKDMNKCVKCLLEDFLILLRLSGERYRIDLDAYRLSKFLFPLLPSGMISGRQEDAHEFLVHIIHALTGANEKPALSSSNGRTPAKASPNFIAALFGGKLASRVFCKGCRNTSKTSEEFVDLALEISSAGTVSSAMDAFCR